MRSFRNVLLIVLVNLLLIAVPLSLIEMYFRFKGGETSIPPNAMWQAFQPYVMSTTAATEYRGWLNTFTGKIIPASIKTNSLGFNDAREFDFTAPYQKALGEKVVLFTGGSAAWGVGATRTEKTIAGRMEFYLNSMQRRDRYTVFNLANGSWIAFQQFIGLQLWGARYNPDWVVVMDGFNDATVGCGYSQGVGNPMYSAAMRSLVQGYMFSSLRPDFYRGWLENQIVKYSAAYRTLTGKQYVPYDAIFDTNSTETRPARRQIVRTKVGAAREVVAFYLAAEAASLRLFPNAGYIFTTQPTVNAFRGDFVDIYDHAHGTRERAAAIAKREVELEAYLSHFENQQCGWSTAQPSFTYIFGNGAVWLERMIEKEARDGRRAQYHNLGTLFPESRDDRKPFFIDPVHLSDRGQDAIGKFLAERILATR